MHTNINSWCRRALKLKSCSTWTVLYSDPPDMSKVVHYEAIGKWAVGILLETFLVVMIHSFSYNKTAIQ